MDTQIAEIRNLYQSSDEGQRRIISKSLRDLTLELEGPMGVIWDNFLGFIQIAVLRTGIELDLFKHLIKSNEPVSVEDLADKTVAAPGLLARLLRYLASGSVVKQASPTHFVATAVCHLLASEAGTAFLIHGYDTVAPSILALPSFLKSSNFGNITDPMHTPFHQAFNTDLSSFEHLARPGNEQAYAAFQKVMTLHQDSKWIEGVSSLNSAAQQITTASPVANEAPVFVDVGGGHGHQCLALLQKYPALKGRVVLQDLPDAIGKLPPIDGVRIMEQNFFEPHGVQGAKYYYLRRILHDWPQTESQKILRNLANAMDGESRIIIDEMSLPDMNASRQAVMADIALMVQMAGVERTRSEWEALFEGVRSDQGRGLEVESVVEYDSGDHKCVTVLRLS